MATLVQIPSSLRDYSGCQSEIRVAGSTVAEILLALQREQPQLYLSICDETGRVRQHINLFVNSKWIPARQIGGLGVGLSSGDILTIWTAVSGG
jgi:molybdopterin converting factor small subunit